MAVSLLLVLSLLSFVPGETIASMAGSGASSRPRNLIGSFGAVVGAGLFHLVGGAAYLLPMLLAKLGMRCFSKAPVMIGLRAATSSFAAVCFLSAFLHLEATAVPTINGMIMRGLAGGIVGQFIGEGLRAVFAGTGAHIVIIAGLLVSVLLTTPLSLGEAVRRNAARWKLWRERIRNRLPGRWPEAQRSSGKGAQQSEGGMTVQPSTMAEQNREYFEPPPVVQTEEPTPDTVDSSEAFLFDPSTDESEQETRRKQTPSIRAANRASDSGEYRLPDPAEILSDPPTMTVRVSDDELKAQSDTLSRALASFGIEGRVTEVRPGPVVTMYEFEPAPGTKVARIVNLADDLALALKAVSLRIVAPLPGKSVVGIEVPNKVRETVSIKEVLMSSAFTKARSKLTLALGKDIFGMPVTADLRTMPHLLVAGATGAGKSVGLNTMLLSILFSAKPNEVKLLLIDPKMLEFQAYEGIPHLLRPVMTDAKSAAKGLGWVVGEMERRYKLLAEAGVRSIDAYNRKVIGLFDGSLDKPALMTEQPELPMSFPSAEERLSAGESSGAMDEPGRMHTKPTPPEPLPYIVVMIDELADLMMVAPKEVEDKLARLAQMARAAGIHLVVATQRPSVDVLTGLIKANFPARIAFQVSSKTDSRTILDANGAEALLGKGDMLYLASGTGRLVRLHGSYVSDDDVKAVVEFVKRQASPSYEQTLQSIKVEEAVAEEAKDELYEQAKEMVLSTGQASASLLQRRLRIGYPRAARLIERMEAEGIVGAMGRDGRREVLGRRGPVGAAEE
ncbi:MAG: DNA translocase FtsK 4TM domain-containing protein [Nitrospira sp.]|nr:DNA translocase FtsK 4TM domain-containing protein [Nitrospira sp.]MCP9464020.1 DNA translocase FtsK 4TM domain-containing protein [Nitrospira sp.]